MTPATHNGTIGLTPYQGLYIKDNLTCYCHVPAEFHQVKQVQLNIECHSTPLGKEEAESNGYRGHRACSPCRSSTVGP